MVVAPPLGSDTCTIARNAVARDIAYTTGSCCKKPTVSTETASSYVSVGEPKPTFPKRWQYLGYKVCTQYLSLGIAVVIIHNTNPPFPTTRCALDECIYPALPLPRARISLGPGHPSIQYRRPHGSVILLSERALFGLRVVGCVCSGGLPTSTTFTQAQRILCIRKEVEKPEQDSYLRKQLQGRE